MKTFRFPLLVTLVILMGVLLSSCSGGTLVNTWPGVSGDENNVYVSNQGQVYAINPSNGTLVWKYPAKADATKPFYAAPAVTNDLIVVGNYGHQLHAIKKDGTAAWQFDPGTGHFVATPLIVGNTILAPASNDYLYALDKNGNKLWEFKTKNMLWATPASDGTTAYLPALDHNLYALNLTDGKQVWKTDLGSSLLSAPLLDGNTLYVSTLEGEVVAVNTTGGNVLWRTKTDGRIWATPLLVKDTLYVGTVTDKGGSIYAIARADGKEAWHKDAGYAVIASPVAIPDGIAFVTEGNPNDKNSVANLTAWSADGANSLWQQPVNGKLYTTPVVTGQNIVVAITQSTEGKLLQAYGLNGQVSWPFIPGK